MYEKGLAIFEKVDKLPNAKLNELYNGLVKTKDQIQQRLQELKLKALDDQKDVAVSFLILIIKNL